jgi:hypothetical protein
VKPDTLTKVLILSTYYIAATLAGRSDSPEPAASGKTTYV